MQLVTLAAEDADQRIHIAGGAQQATDGGGHLLLQIIHADRHIITVALTLAGIAAVVIIAAVGAGHNHGAFAFATENFPTERVLPG